MKRLILVGGGHAHVHVLARFARANPAGVSLTLVAPVERQLYSGMLPGWLAGHYRLDECAIPLDALAQAAGARFVRAACSGLLCDTGRVECDDGDAHEFDWLSLDVGSAAATLPRAVVAEQTVVVPVRPIEGLVAGLEALLARVAEGRPEQVVVIGGGAAAIELAFALRARFDGMGVGRVRLCVIGAEHRPLTGLPRLLQWRAAGLMRARGIAWRGGCRVTAIEDGWVRLADGDGVPATTVLVCAGARAHAWLAASGLATDADGYLQVDRTLRSLSDPRIFAVGDCAAYIERRPKSGVFAVRAGPPLAENLSRALRGEALRPWRPQRRALYLVSTGTRHALGAWGALGWWGDWVWRWKDRIDRAFVGRYATPKASVKKS